MNFLQAYKDANSIRDSSLIRHKNCKHLPIEFIVETHFVSSTEIRNLLDDSYFNKLEYYDFAFKQLRLPNNECDCTPVIRTPSGLHQNVLEFFFSTFHSEAWGLL